MSYGNELKQLYLSIDNKVVEYYIKYPEKKKCHSGCSDCCSQFFEISMVEYLVLLDDILKLKKDKLTILFNKSKEYMEHMKLHYNSLYNQVTNLEESSLGKETRGYFNKERFLFYKPCILLDESTGKCMFYEVRPLICRTTGTGYCSHLEILRVCPNIGATLFLSKNRANLTQFSRQIATIDTLEPLAYKNHNQYQTITFKKRPIGYYIYDTFIDKKSTQFYQALSMIYMRETRESVANSLFEERISK